MLHNVLVVTTLLAAPCLQEDEVLAFQKRLEADAFDFNDFLDQFKRVNNMGGLQMLKLMPGFSGVSEKQLYEVEKKLKRYEGMISSMTAEVRQRVQLLLLLCSKLGIWLCGGRCCRGTAQHCAGDDVVHGQQ
jgi:signal recognition particle GTPase